MRELCTKWGENERTKDMIYSQVELAVKDKKTKCNKRKGNTYKKDRIVLLMASISFFDESVRPGRKNT